MTTSPPNSQEKPSFLVRVYEKVFDFFGTNSSFKEDWKNVAMVFSILVALTSGTNFLSSLIAFFFSPSLESAVESNLSPESLHGFFAFYLSTFPTTFASTVMGLYYIHLFRHVNST